MNVRSLVLALGLMPVLSRPAAATWPSDPTMNVPLCVEASHQFAPQAVSDGKGGAIVVWNDQRGGGYDVFVQRVDANGTPRWTQDGVPVCNLPHDKFEPILASDGAGGAIIAWTDYRGSTYDVYAQRVDSTGTLKWTAGGVAIANLANDQWMPAILADGSGGAFLAWADERALAGYGHIYVQRVSASGAMQWVSTGMSTNNVVSGQANPRIVSNGSGGVIVAWEDYRNGEQDIFAQRIQSNGFRDPLWPVEGRAIATLGQDQEIRGLVADGAGGALVTWPQWNGLTRDIFVHRVLSTGALDPAWPATGRRIQNDSYDQSEPAILSDGAGGVLVTYTNQNSVGRDIRAHRVRASGAVDPAWPDSGLVLCSSVGDKDFPTIVASDSAAIVGWLDERDGGWDLYANRFLRNGLLDPNWPVDGRAICTADSNQSNFAIVPDSTGGAIFAWEDRRVNNEEGDIYAQAVKNNGQLGDPPVGVPGDAQIGLALRAPYPNPVRAGSLRMHFTLPHAAPASLEVFTVAGRRVAGREVGTLGAGPHAVDLRGTWSEVPGVYFVRLTQGHVSRVQRVVLLD